MPRQDNTKDLFLLEALKLFAEKGYDRVTLQEIAKRVGCVPSALYKHYKNKQELYDDILEKSAEGNKMYLARMEQLRKHDVDNLDLVVGMSVEERVTAMQELFLETVHDEWVSNFRKLMMIEQFHMPELGMMYDARYIDSKVEFFTAWIRLLMDKGLVEKEDPQALAVMLSYPFSLAIGVVDRDPSKEQWALNMLADNVRLFSRTYIKY